MGAFAIVVLLERAPLTAGMVCCQVSERRFVGCAVAPEAAGVRGPRIVGRASARAAAGAATGPAGPTGPAAAEAAAGPVGLGDLGRGVAHGRAYVIDLDLVDGPLLAFPGLIGPLAQPAVDDHPHAPLQALGHVLGRLAPSSSPGPSVMIWLRARGCAAAQWRSGRKTLVRRTASFRPSWRSSSR